MLIGIIQNEDPQSAYKWIKSCEKAGLDFTVFNIVDTDFIYQVINSKCDFYLLKPPGAISHYKTLYDEKLYYLIKFFGVRTYPKFDELFIYENKRNLTYFLQTNDLPHPTTKIAYSYESAMKSADNLGYPCVAKTAIGASGSGVIILRNKVTLTKYLNKAFSAKGIRRRFGPNRVTGSSQKWLSKTISDPKYFLLKLKEYQNRHRDAQKGFVILQKYIPHDFEWRVVKIGDNYFAHKKIKYGDMASGSKGVDYVNPPKKLLDFVRDTCDKFGFNSMAIDLFEDGKGDYLINELQTIFGHVQSHILEVDGIPGRYLFQNNEWIFEAGDFNTNESYDLRLEAALKLYGK